MQQLKPCGDPRVGRCWNCYVMACFSLSPMDFVGKLKSFSSIEPLQKNPSGRYPSAPDEPRSRETFGFDPHATLSASAVYQTLCGEWLEVWHKRGWLNDEADRDNFPQWCNKKGESSFKLLKTVTFEKNHLELNRVSVFTLFYCLQSSKQSVLYCCVVWNLLK